jgi:hypothetical protein
MEDVLIPVNIVVGDRTYRVRIEQEHEEIVRKTVKVINDKLLEFKTNFAGKDMQDYIAMVVLWYATTTAEQGNAGVGSGSSVEMMTLESILDKALI